MTCGVYMIVNRVNGKIYVGLSKNMEARWSIHRTPRNTQKRTVLARAFHKYGVENFDCVVLVECPVEQLAWMEKLWILALRPHYNMKNGGEGFTGVPVSESTRKLLAESTKARWENLSPERRERMIDGLRKYLSGHKVSAETKSKLRSQNLGTKRTMAVRATMSDAQKQRWKIRKQNVNSTTIS